MLPVASLVRRFDPRSIPGLEAWWDAADSASVTLDSGRVSQWNDKSGNGRHAANSTSGSTQPDYITQGRNSLNVLRLAAASSQRLTVASSTSAFNFLHNGTQSLVWIVASFGATADPNANYNVIANAAGATGNVGVRFAFDDRTIVPANNEAAVGIYRGATGAPTAETTGLPSYDNLISPQTFVIWETALDVGNATASNRVSVRINGGSAVEGNTYSNTPSTSNATYNLQIGANGNNGGFMTGDFCEIILYSQFPTADARTAIRTYLSRKWGVTLS